MFLLNAIFRSITEKYNTFDMQHRNLSRFDKNKSDEEDYLWRDLGDEAMLKFL